MNHRMHAIAALAAILLALPAAAQQPEVRTKHNVLYLELGGNALIYSVNYERFFTDDLAVRVGAGFLSATGTDTAGNSARVSILLAPLMLGYTGARSGAHAFEVGGGLVLAHAGAKVNDTGGTDFKSGTEIWPSATLGYRYAPLSGGFHFKAAFTPVLAAGNFLPWFGISAGVIF